MTTLTLSRPYPPTREEVARAVTARSALVPFAQWMWAGFQNPPHIVLLANELEAIERGENDRLIIEMPVRHGKSWTASVYFPAYYMCRDPVRRVISASYGATLAHKFGGRVRNLLLSDYRRDIFPEFEVERDSRAKDLWDTTAGGGYVATGIPGPITGQGANLLNIDDPIRGIQDAYSETVRDSVWDWYDADALTRLEPGSAVVITASRWHHDDLIGRVLEREGRREEGGAWRVVRIPALAEEGDPLGREPGQALWPARYDEDWLLAVQERSPRVFLSLYQQNPTPDEGAIFKWWSEYDRIEGLQGILLPIDTAYTEDERSDYTAVAAWGITDSGHIDLMGAKRWQLETPRAEAEIFKLYAALVSRYPGVAVTPLVRKRVAIDRVMAQHLRARKLPVVEVELPAGNSKEALANMVSDYFEAGLARVPKDKPPWFQAWHSEHLRFPADPHDDWVETTIIALHHFRGYRPIDVPDIDVRFEFSDRPGKRVPRFKQRRNGSKGGASAVFQRVR